MRASPLQIRIALAVVSLAIAASPPATARQNDAPAKGSVAPALSPGQWQADLDTLAIELPRRHTNAFARTSEPDFTRSVAELRERIPSLDTPAIVLGMARVVASLRDAHTLLETSKYAFTFRRYPLAFTPFKDGVLVTASAPQREELRGLVLKSIDGMPVEQAIDRVATVYPWENTPAKLHKLRDTLANATVLRVTGVTRGEENAVFEFSMPKTGQTIAENISSLLASEVRLEHVRLLPKGPATITFQRRGPSLWWDVLPGTHTLYVRYDRCTNDLDGKVDSYAHAVEERLDQGGITQLIIDLRTNGGGDSSLLDPFIGRLSRRTDLKPRGARIALIGRATFSSAQMNAVALKSRAGALLVGGPTGQRPNAFGEVKSFELPNSGLKVQYSTKYFMTEEGDAESTMPDFEAESTIAEFLDGRDPVVEAALLMAPSEPAPG